MICELIFNTWLICSGHCEGLFLIIPEEQEWFRPALITTVCFSEKDLGFPLEGPSVSPK